MSDRFHLRKWYFDCVTETGDAAILYAARLRWRVAVLHYTSVLTSVAGTLQTKSSLHRFPAIEDERDLITLDLKAIGVHSEHRALSSSISRTVYEGVEWHCVQPKADAVITANGHSFAGYGYAERLELTVAPWKLPLHELQWGHYASSDDSLIWIDWRGDYRKTVVLHNGDEISDAEVGISEIRVGPNAALTLDRRTTLRSGQLSETVLPNTPALRQFLPQRVFGIQETKWCSKAKFASRDRSSSGCAIHEVVVWTS